MTDDLTLDQRLRDLDAAPRDEPIDRDRQARLLDSLLAAERDVPVETAPHLSRRPTRRLGWAATAAAAAVIAAAVVVLPTTNGGHQAFASWTRVPRAASDQDARALRSACLDQVGDTMGGDGAPRVASDDLRTRLVDRRGDWVSVLLTWTGPDRYQLTVACLGRLREGSADEPTDVTHSLSGGGGWAAPAGHELVEGPMSEFSVGSGFLGLGRSERVATTNGEVGREVVGVTIHAGPSTVEASVEDGTYAAWWPGRLMVPTTDDAPSGEHEPEPMLRYDVTLRDGTVLRDVDPAHPAG
jgi:hypothetical protein